MAHPYTAQHPLGTTPKSGLLEAVAGMSDYQRRNYNVVRLINSMADEAQRARLARPDSTDMFRHLRAAQLGLAEREQQPTARTPVCEEEEIGQDISRQLGPPPHGGVWMPTRIRAGLSTLTDGAGKVAVGSDVLNFIDVLSAASTCIRLGAQIISGLRGNTSWPLETAEPEATWCAENSGSDIGEDDPVFDQALALPKMLSSTTSYSRKLLSQSAPGIDNWILRRLARAHAATLDAGTIAGDGSNNAVTGILSTTGVGLHAIGTNGGLVSVAALIDMEKILSDANGLAGGLLTTTGIRSVLRTLPAFSGATVPVWGPDNLVLGYQGHVSTRMPSNGSKGTSSPPTQGLHSLILADWTGMVIGEFGALELVTDVYTAKKQAQIQVTSYGVYSVSIIRPAAFVICTDAKVS